MEVLSLFTVAGIIGPYQLVVIILLIVLLFGAKKIPELMRGAGKGVREFKDALNGDITERNSKETTDSSPEAKKGDSEA